MDRPNILYMHSHDTGRYVQPYGYAIPTPNLQALAEQGTLFRKCFCAGPTCSPSRAALLTGQNCHSAGMIGLAHRGFSLQDYSRHLIHTLRKAGYKTALAGVQHVDRHGAERIGYDEILPQTGTAAGVAAAAEQYLRAAAKERADGGGAQPFFLSVGFVRTHRVYPEPGPREDARYCLPPAPLPDTPETRHDMACFKAAARELDMGMGQVLDALRNAGLEGDTLVICTTDHGIAFPLMKCNLTDHGTGVMLIVRGPGGFDGGKVCDAMVSHVDVYPTLCDLLGVDRPAWLEGESLLPLVRGEAEEIHDEIFSEVTYHAAYEPMRAVRTRRHKYIRRYDDRGRPILPNCDGSVSKDLLLEHGWAERAPQPEQLYDLVFDPNESCNVAADPAYADVLAEMRSRLDAWMERTDDPLLGGLPVPAPSGAKVNDPDGLSPNEPVRTVP